MHDARVVALDRTYFFARHGEAIVQRAMLRAETCPEGTDWPLSAAGEAQARDLGRAFARAGCERIVSSTLTRARRTAELASAESGIPYAGEWAELDEISARSLWSRRRAPEWWAGIRGAWQVRCCARGAPFDETGDAAAIERRIRAVLARLDAMAERRIAVVSHGYLIFLVSVVVPGAVPMRPMRNGSITRVLADGRGSYRLAAFAEPTITRAAAR